MHSGSMNSFVHAGSRARTYLPYTSDHINCHFIDLMIFLFILFRAAKEECAYARMKEVVRWYLSGFYKKPKVSGGIV